MEEVLGSLSLVALVVLIVLYIWFTQRPPRWVLREDYIEPRLPTEAERAHVAWIIKRFTMNSANATVHETWTWESRLNRWNVALRFTYCIGDGMPVGIREWRMLPDPEFKEGAGDGIW
jgi:hypothetical protein